MATGSFSSPTMLLTIIVLSFLTHSVSPDSPSKNRVALEIVIGGNSSGGGGVSSSPPPPICPPPPPPPPLALQPGNSPPPKPPSPPAPVSPFFASARIERAFNVIKKFRGTIKGDPFNVTSTWSGPDVCGRYKGYLCARYPTDNTLAVYGIDFNGFGLSGYDECLSLDILAEMKELSFFHVNSNNFTGPIPDKIKDLPYLYELDVSNNKLSGEFPTAVLTCKNLTYIDIRYNRFTGAVPPQVFNLDLDVLFLNNNGFGQNLPDNLGSTNAIYITLANNQFTGCVPRSFGGTASKNLVEILLLNNTLSGCLPYEIGLLEKARVFDIGLNSLTGPIPLSFSCLKRMEILNLAQNQLYGPIPEMVCQLPNLANLSLSYNYFTEVGPECRKLLELKRLDVRMNCVLGLPSQRPQSECSAFFLRPRRCPDEKWRYEYIPCRK